MADSERLLRDVIRSFQRPPGEVFDDLIRKGFVDRQGRVTRLIGGRAEPEPEALARPAHDRAVRRGGGRRVRRSRTAAKSASRRKR